MIEAAADVAAAMIVILLHVATLERVVTVAAILPTKPGERRVSNSG